MTIVVDTNVMISALFWDGLPFEVVIAGLSGQVQLAVSRDVWNEYELVGQEFQKKQPSTLFGQMIAQLAGVTRMVVAKPLPAPVCRDPDDDKFLACALAANADFLVTGDRDLLALDGRFLFRIVRPRDFLSRLASRQR